MLETCRRRDANSCAVNGSKLSRGKPRELRGVARPGTRCYKSLEIHDCPYSTLRLPYRRHCCDLYLPQIPKASKQPPRRRNRADSRQPKTCNCGFKKAIGLKFRSRGNRETEARKRKQENENSKQKSETGQATETESTERRCSHAYQTSHRSQRNPPCADHIHGVDGTQTPYLMPHSNTKTARRMLCCRAPPRCFALQISKPMASAQSGGATGFYFS